MMRATQQGIALLPAIVAITIVAAVAFLISQQSAINNKLIDNAAKTDTAYMVAEAGFNHVRWLTQQSNCSGYPNPFLATIGGHSYKVNVSPLNGSPVTFTAQGTLAGGASHVITRHGIRMFDLPDTQVLQLGTDEGKDVLLDSLNKSVNFGAGFAGVSTNPTQTKHYLLQFDLTGLPPGVKVSSATLELYQTAALSVGSDPKINVYRIMRAWTEGTKSGTGTPDGATWERHDGTSSWSLKGGDYDPTLIASEPVTVSTGTWIAWDVTTLVDGWITGRIKDNFGFLLKGSGDVNVTFSSKEDVNATWRPKLTVTTVCECGFSCSTSPVSGYYRDELTVRNCTASDYSGTNGTLDWSTTSWQELSDNGLSCGWNVELREDANVSDPGNYRMYMRGEGRGYTRQANLATFSKAYLNFEYRRVDFGNPPDRIQVDLSTDGGSNWIAINQIPGPGTDSKYEKASFDISAHAGGNITIRFMLMDVGAADAAYFDNVEISETPPACDGNYKPQTEVSNWDISGYSTSPRAIAYLPGGITVNSINIPAEGGWVWVNSVSGTSYVMVTDITGAALTDFTLPGVTNEVLAGVSYISSGTHSGKMAYGAKNGTYELLISDLNGNVTANWDLGVSESNQGITFVSAGTYAGLLIPVWDTYGLIIDGNGNQVGTLNYPSGVNQVKSITHLPGGDLFALQDTADEKIYIVKLSGALPNVNSTIVNEFDLTQFSIHSTSKGASINPLTCDYVLIDQGNNLTRVVNKSISSPPPSVCDGTFRDEFNNMAYSNNDGSLNWTAPWQEINENDGPTAGDEKIMQDLFSNRLRIQDDDGGGEGVSREADLSASTNATLSFVYRRHGMDNANDYVKLEISSNGGLNWTELDRFAGPATDWIYTSKSYDISAYISANTQIRFLSGPSLGHNEKLYIDNVQIETSGCSGN